MDDIKFHDRPHVERRRRRRGKHSTRDRKYYGTSREIELAAVSVDEPAYERSNGTGSNGVGAITHADLVSLDSIDFDHDRETGDVGLSRQRRDRSGLAFTHERGATGGPAG